MDLSFANRKLQKECEWTSALTRAHGKAGARKLMARLADLAAAASLEEMRQLPGRCHELSGDRKGQLAIDLTGGKRLVFEPAADPPPQKEDGGLDWEAVDAIRIIEIIDYH
jgi:plasmid maintenance system killer protein